MPPAVAARRDPVLALGADGSLRSRLRPAGLPARRYIATLDYIFYDPAAFGVECWVPVPSVADVRESAGGALPSARYPSDHVALVAEFSADKVGRATAAAGERRPTMPLPASRYNVGKAAAAVRAGGVLALPTDTIYGVAAAAESSVGVRRLYALKGRDQAVPLALCVADAADVGRYGEAAHLPEGLLAALLPGPFTVILRQRADAAAAPVAPEINAAMAVKTVGLRVPDCAFIRAVCRAAGTALALTSANRSGAPSTVDVWEPVWERGW